MLVKIFAGKYVFSVMYMSRASFSSSRIQTQGRDLRVRQRRDGRRPRLAPRPRDRRCRWRRACRAMSPRGRRRAAWLRAVLSVRHVRYLHPIRCGHRCPGPFSSGALRVLPSARAPDGATPDASLARLVSRRAALVSAGLSACVRACSCPVADSRAASVAGAGVRPRVGELHSQRRRAAARPRPASWRRADSGAGGDSSARTISGAAVSSSTVGTRRCSWRAVAETLIPATAPMMERRR